MFAYKHALQFTSVSSSNHRMGKAWTGATPERQVRRGALTRGKLTWHDTCHMWNGITMSLLFWPYTKSPPIVHGSEFTKARQDHIWLHTTVDSFAQKLQFPKCPRPVSSCEPPEWVQSWALCPAQCRGSQAWGGGQTLPAHREEGWSWVCTSQSENTHWSQQVYLRHN